MNLGMPSINAMRAGRPLTGRMVLFILLAFFGLVIAVNLVMVREAISTFGGVDTPSSYQAGLDFKAEEQAIVAQDALHWRVDVRLTPGDRGEKISLTALDANGKALSGYTVTARFAHPADERRDVTVALQESSPGTYTGLGVVDPGQWTLDLAIGQGSRRLFHSTNRIMVQ